MARRASGIYGASARRCSRLLFVPWSTYQYRSERSADAGLKQRVREIAHQHITYGYRRVLQRLQAEGWPVGKTRVQRIYREEGLALRRRKPKRRVQAALRRQRANPTRVNEVWAMDVVHDRLENGDSIRVLAAVDIFSRSCRMLTASARFTSQDVVTALSQAIKTHGKPDFIRCDNGTEFTGIKLDIWSYQQRVMLDFSRPGKPTDNAFIESFNARFRAECLSQHYFESLDAAQKRFRNWQRSYNSECPHSSLGGLTPKEFELQQCQENEADRQAVFLI